MRPFPFLPKISKALAGYFGIGPKKQRQGNQTRYSAPREIQLDYMLLAAAKRERKMARPQGWYNGNRKVNYGH